MELSKAGANSRLSSTFWAPATCLCSPHGIAIAQCATVNVQQHADGRGFNINLDAMPIDGKLVLREPKDDEPEPQPARKGGYKK